MPLLIIESTRAIGYSLGTAVASIDNSIAANAKMLIYIFSPVDGSYIAILGNGKGMAGRNRYCYAIPKVRIRQKKENKKDLGRFGFGIKN